MKHSEDFEKWIAKDTPLGDESKRFELRELKEALRNKSGNLFSKIENMLIGRKRFIRKIATVSEASKTPLKIRASVVLGRNGA